MTTFYRRETLATPDGMVRVTIDRDFGIYAPVSPGAAGQRATPPRLLAPVNETIIEVKTIGGSPAWLDPILAGLEPSTVFSKFTLAMEAVAGLPMRIPISQKARTGS